MITFSSLEDAVQRLNEHSDYRVLRRFSPRNRYAEAGPLPEYIGIYLDTETTGTDYQKDGILELAMVPFNYTLEGEVTKVYKAFTALNDPGFPITDQIRKITGISPEDIVGCKIEFGPEERSLLASADLVIAHNASFDRPFVEKINSNFQRKKWACSQQDVPWREQFGALSERLEVLAMTQCSVFYEAHRALIDCQIGIHVLATARDAQGRTALSHLLEASERESVRVWAVGSPFHTKEILKARGYRWNDGTDGRPKAWHKVLTPDQLDEENEWLRYTVGCHPRVTTTSAIDRYSTREQ